MQKNNKSDDSDLQSETMAEWSQNWDKYFDNALVVLEGHICKIFLKAVREHDGNRIKEIAQAVWYFKDKIDNLNLGKKDPVRFALLSVKNLIDMTDTPMPFDVVLQFVEQGIGRKIVGHENNYSDFRKLCKEIGIRIEPSRKIRKK